LVRLMVPVVPALKVDGPVVVVVIVVVPNWLMEALLAVVAETTPAVMAGSTMPPPVAVNVAFPTAPTAGTPADVIELAVMVTKLPLIEPAIVSVPMVVMATLPVAVKRGAAAIAAVTGLLPPPRRETVGAAVKPVPALVRPTEATAPDVLITAVAAADVPPALIIVTVGATV